MQTCKLPNEAKHLAWLSLDTQEGMEYWFAMNLAGDYASACHHVIHDKIAKVLNEEPICRVENHHNFAWKEMHNGQELIVHRRTTPAGKNVLGIIPGSMTAPGYRKWKRPGSFLELCCTRRRSWYCHIPKH